MNFISKEWIDNWKNFSVEQRLNCLQKFENDCAYFEKRDRRKIVIDSKSVSYYNNDRAYYTFENPSVISLRKISDNIFESIANVFHEGFHAATDDFFCDKYDLLMLFDIDKDKLKAEYVLRDIIHNYCIKNNKEILFNIAYYEEKIVRKQTYFFLLMLAINICDNENEFEDLLKKYFHKVIIVEFYSYNKFLKSQESSCEYDEFIKTESFLSDVEKYSDKKRLFDTNKEILIVSNQCDIGFFCSKVQYELGRFESKQINEHNYIYNLKKLYSKYHSKFTLETFTFS